MLPAKGPVALSHACEVVLHASKLPYDLSPGIQIVERVHAATGHQVVL